MKKAYLLLLGVLFIAVQALAQRTVTGKVTDESGAPITGVSVLVKGSKVGTTTSSDGTYSIKVPEGGKVLVFSSVNFEEVEMGIGNQSSISLKLKSQQKALEEVVVVTYGVAKKETFTGSAAKISAKDIQNRPLTNVSTALIGSAPGVSATTANGQPGSAPSIRIRGFGSISASSEPLYVVDGVPFTAAIGNINMDDVESISVLKDAATTSLYGSRAANGVVMITTKKGRKGRNLINAKFNTSFTSRAIPDYDRVGASDYIPLMWEGYRNSLVYRATPTAGPRADSIASGLITGQTGIMDLLVYNPYNLPRNQVMFPSGQLNPNASMIFNQEDLDWFSPITRNGVRNEYSVNFSGGSDKTDYLMSFAYTKENGYIKRSDFERFNARLNVNTQIKEWFKTGMNLAFIRSGGNFASTDGSNSIVNPFFFAARMGPIYPYYAYNPASPGQYLLDANGNKQYDFGNATLPGLPLNRPAGAYAGRHTIAENELSREFFRRNVFNGRTYAEISLFEGMKFTTNLGVDYTNRYDVTFQNRIIGDGAPAGRSSKDYQTLVGVTFNQLLNYDKKIGRSNFGVLLGHESFSDKQDFLSGTRQGQVVDNNVELINFTTTTNLSSQEDNRSIESYFGNLKYDFDGKYFFTLGGRTDGNSRFSKDFRWGRFWSVSGAWVVSKERFMKNVGFVNFLKLRSSYGTTGNEAGIGFYAYQTLYNLGLNNGLTPGVLQSSSLGNDSLTWEKNKQFDIAIDFELFRSRIRGSVEYFNRVSDDLLFSVPLPVSSGFGSIFKNVGSMYNRGVELMLDADIIKTKDFTWNFMINATTLTNKITRLPQKEIISGTKKLMVGQSIFDYWLRQWYGVDPNDGAALFVADNPLGAGVRITSKGDTVSTSVNNAKFGYVGSSIPDWFGSLQTSFSYKGITLSALANWQLGGLTYDDTYAAYMHSGTYGASLHTDMLKRWRKPGDITEVPRMDNGQTSIFGATSSRWLTSASFLNIQNISLSYDMTSSRVLNKLHLTSARFFVSAENVNMFTKRKGMNPGQAFSGVTSIGYIPARVVNFGVNVNL